MFKQTIHVFKSAATSVQMTVTTLFKRIEWIIICNMWLRSKNSKACYMINIHIEGEGTVWHIMVVFQYI